MADHSKTERHSRTERHRPSEFWTRSEFEPPLYSGVQFSDPHLLILQDAKTSLNRSLSIWLPSYEAVRENKPLEGGARAFDPVNKVDHKQFLITKSSFSLKLNAGNSIQFPEIMLAKFVV